MPMYAVRCLYEFMSFVSLSFLFFRVPIDNSDDNDNNNNDDDG